jgi:Family of unknown function (DUF5681)
MSTNSDEKIGYRNPPQRTQFKKGHSGNPKGRPKGKRNLATVLEKTLHEKVVINENGRRKTITKLEAAVKQLVNKAASGDLRALHQLAALAAPRMSALLRQPLPHLSWPRLTRKF